MAASSCHGPFDEANPLGLVEENGREWPQKGDYNGQMSFAIASIILKEGEIVVIIFLALFMGGP